jgi:formate/nitrite transporter FocA (FNT family)
MTEKIQKTNPLRLIAAVILGIMVGAILFLVVALVIGAFNDRSGMNIPINMLVAENIFSLALLLILMVASIGYFWWKVSTTPPSEPETEEE